MPTIGILGAGKLGITLAQLALRAGYRVVIARSGDPGKIKLTAQILAPGARVATAADAARQADIVVLAFPLSRYRELPVDELAGKVVIDATNYWWEVDGNRDDSMAPAISSSQQIARLLQGSRVVKGLNHMGYHDLHDEPKPRGTTGRKAIAIAGDDHDAVERVSELVDAIGFDPIRMGNLADGQILEPSGPVFGANVDAATLRKLLGI